MSVAKKLFVKTFMIIFRGVVQCYTYLTLPIYYWMQKPNETLAKTKFQRAKQLNPADPYSPWVRATPTKFHVLTTSRSVAEASQIARRLHHWDRPAVGYRRVIEEHVVTDGKGSDVRVDGKVLRKFRLSSYNWMTYGQVWDRVDSISRGLVLKGFQRGQMIVVLAETCVDNLIFLQVAINIGAIYVTVFTTLGDDGIVHCINETNATIVYTTYDLLPKLKDLCPKCPSIQTVLYVDSHINNNNNPQMLFPEHFKLLSMSKLYSDGQFNKIDIDGMQMLPDEVIFISYTSGTTGQPKGIVLTSSQLARAGICTSAAMEKFMSEPERHIYIAYLPQSHSLEMSIEMYAFLGGCPIGFASPFTLNESAPGLANGETCDLRLLRPTIMVTVPLVLDRMRKEIYHKLKARTPVSQDIFSYLIDYKTHWTDKGYICPIVNALLCPKIKVQFGGRLEHMVVGGAALSPDLQSLIKAALNITLVQGYGLTETFGAVLCMDDYDMSKGMCGSPLKDVQIRLEDWDDGGYRATDKPNPRGELVVGGHGVASGYYNNDELTNESFIYDSNGMRWFRTGDIGEVFPDGTFKIIDRKKDLIKLSNGEYFSLGKIESCLKNCTFVDNICVCGDIYHSYLTALVIPNPKSIESLAKELQLNELTFEELCQNKSVVEVIHKDIIESGLHYKLNRREIPNKIRVLSDEWTPDNHMLTAALKLKRTSIHSKYKKDIESMFT